MEKSIKEMTQQEFEAELRQCEKELKTNPNEIAKLKMEMLQASRIHCIP